MPKTLTNYLLILLVALAPLQAFATPFASGSGEPCRMHQSGKARLQSAARLQSDFIPSSACPDCTDRTCNKSDCSPDHCSTANSQISTVPVNTIFPVGNQEVRDSILAIDIASRSDPPLLRPPV